MKKSYKEMTAEECAKHYIKGGRRFWLFYVAALLFVLFMHVTALDVIGPLLDYGNECEGIYYDLVTSQNVRTVLLVAIVFCFAFVDIILRYNAINNIYVNDCDPEKYIEVEKIICKKSYHGWRSKRQKCFVGSAYAALKDYDTAWSYFSKIIPKDIDKDKDVFILSTLASYFCNVGNEEEFLKYQTRLEALQAAGKKNANLDMMIKHLRSVVAIREKRFDEAKEYINSYMDKARMSVSVKAVNHYNLGEIAYEEKDYPEAIYRYKTVIETGGKLWFVDDAKEKLAEITK